MKWKGGKLVKQVTVFTSNTCPYCNALKEYLIEHHIPYEEKNISRDSSARDELISLGVRSVPYTLVEGEAVTGFDKEKLDELLR